jgi:RNase P subunit RPR2
MMVNFANSPYGVACTRCNDILIAPDASEYVSERHVGHSWSCESCGEQFLTADRFNAPFNARARLQSVPLAA